MQRRKAIKTAALGVGVLGLNSLTAYTTGKKITNMKELNVGIQLFTIPQLVDQDFRGTLARLSEIGYQEIEFFGPYPGSTAKAKTDFEMMQNMLGLQRHAFYGLSEKETAALLKEYNLRAPSIHVTLETLQNGLPSLLESLEPIGTKYIVLPAILEMELRNSRDAYQKLADTFNEFGKTAQQYGVKFLYHNHGYEHQEMEGQTPLNLLIENTDPELVGFELDIFWMAAAGADPITYLKKYPGRFKALHVKDAAETFRFEGNGDTPQEWMAGFPQMADPGTGVFDITAIVEVAKTNGVDHFFLERDLTPEPEKTLTNSFEYLRKL